MGMKADGNLYIAAQFLDTFDEIGKQVEKGAAKISNNTKIDLSVDEKKILKEIDSLIGSVKFKDLDLSDIVNSVFASISKEGMSSKDRTKILDDFQYNLRMLHSAPLKTIKQLKGVKSEDLTEILQEIQTDSLSDNPKRKWTSVNLKNNVKEIISEKLRTTIDDAIGGIQETLIGEFGKDVAKYGVSEKEANNKLNNIYDSLVEKAKEQSKIEGNNVGLDEIVTDNELKSIQGFYSRIESLGGAVSDKAKKLADMLTSMSNDGAIEEELDDIIYQISEDVNSFTEKEKQLIQEFKQKQKENEELNKQNKSSAKQTVKPKFDTDNGKEKLTPASSQPNKKENEIQEDAIQQHVNNKILEQTKEISATNSEIIDKKKEQTQEVEKQNSLLKEQKQIENKDEVDEYEMADFEAGLGKVARDQTVEEQKKIEEILYGQQSINDKRIITELSEAEKKWKQSKKKYKQDVKAEDFLAMEKSSTDEDINYLNYLRTLAYAKQNHPNDKRLDRFKTEMGHSTLEDIDEEIETIEEQLQETLDRIKGRIEQLDNQFSNYPSYHEQSFSEENNSSMAVSQDQVQQEIQETALTAQVAAGSNKQLAESVQEVTQAVQEEKEAFSDVEKQIKGNNSILYHYGDYAKNKPSHQFGDEKRAWFNGIDNQGVGYADGTGTYVSNHMDEYSPSKISDKVSKKFYSIDVSKLNLYEAHTEEQAEIFYKFIHHLEQYCIMLGSGFEGFADNLKDVDAQSLYRDFQKVFPSIEMSFEEFNDFISRMRDLVVESGMDVNGEIDSKKLSEFKNKNGIDDIKTRFLKKLGYHGTNLSGTSYGGLRNGSVLFDDNARLFTVTSGKLLSDVAQEAEEIINTQSNILQKHNIKITGEDLIGASPTELEQIRNLLKEIYDNEIQLQNVKSGSRIESSIKEKINDAKTKIEEIKNNISTKKENNIIQDNLDNQLVGQEQESTQIQKEKLDITKEEVQAEQQLTNELKEQKNIEQTLKEVPQENKKESELQTIKEIKEETQQVAEQQQKVTEAKQETLQVAQEELKTEQQLSTETQNQEKPEEKKPTVALKGKKLANAPKHGKTQAEIDVQLKANEEKKKKKTSTSKVDLEEKERANNAAAADAKADEEKQRQQAIEDQNFLAALRAKLAEAEAKQAEKEAQKIQVTSEKMQRLKQEIQEATNSLKEYKEIDDKIIQAQKDRNSFIQLSSTTAEETMGLTSAPDLAEYIRGVYREYKKTGNEDDKKKLQESLRKYFMPQKTQWAYEKNDGTKQYTEAYVTRAEKFSTQKNGKDISKYVKDKKFQEFIQQAKQESEAYEKARRTLPELEYQKMSGQEKYSAAASQIQQLLQEAGLDADKVNEILAAINGNLTNEEAIWKVINSYIKEASEELDKQKEAVKETESSVLEKPKEDGISKVVSENKIEQTDIVGQEEKNQQAVEKTIELTEKLQEQTQELITPKTSESSIINQIGEEAEKTKEKVDEVVDSVKNVKDEAKKQSISKKTNNTESEFSEKIFAQSYIKGSTPPFEEAKRWINSGVKTDNIEKLKTYYQQYENIVNKIKSTKETPETKPRFKAWAEEYNKVRESVISVIDAIKKVDSEENKILNKQKAQKDIIKGTINNRAILAQNTQTKLDSNYYDKQISRADNLLSQYTPTESPEAAKAIEQTNKALEEYKNKLIELKQFASGDLQLDRPFEELIKEINKADDEVKELTKNIKDNFSKLANDNSVIDLKTKIDSLLGVYGRISPDNKQKLKDISDALIPGQVVTKQLADYKTQVKQVIAVEKEAGNLGNSIWDRMIGKAQEGIAFLATKFSFYQIFNQFRQGFEVIHQFDDALTEMMKVSDETRLSLERYQKTTFDTADAIGTSALQIQNSTADFMRLGETLTEAAESAKTANVLMNVSEFQSIDEATKSLIAMSAAYDDLSKMNIIDKLNEVGNNYAISTSEAATALQASASALKTANNDMDEALALITAGNAVVQDATKVGAGMRTIALRLTGTKTAKEELEEMGEETENVITTQSKLRDTIKEATAVASNEFKGFDILDNNGNYKSTYEIMLGIADVYNEIVETDKQLGRNNANLLLESVAGKNRANIAASIFQNPQLLRDAYKSSQEANGSAMRENDKFVQSISGHLAQLTNAWQEMWANAANRDVINFFIDAAKAVVNFANAIGIIPSTLLVGLPFFEMISRAKTGKGVVSGFFEWAAKLPEAKKFLEETTKAQTDLNAAQEAGVAIDNAKTASNEAKTASTIQAAEAQTAESATDITGVDSSMAKTAANEAETLSAEEQAAAYTQLGESEALEQTAEKGKGFFTTMGLGVKGLISTIGAVPLAIASIVAILAIVKNRVDALRESWFSDAKDITNKINEQQESMSQQIESYNTLKKQLDSGDLSEQETLDTKQKIFDIQKSISDQYGSQAQGLDLVNGKLETQIDLLNSITQKNAEEQYGRGLSGFRVAREEYEKNNRNYNIKLNGSTNSSLNKAISEAYDKAGLRMVNAGMGTFNANVSGTAIDSIETLQRARKELENLKKEYRDPKMLEHLDDQISNIEEQISEAYEIVEKYEETALKGMELDLAVNNRDGYDIFTNYQSSVSNLEDAYISGDTKKINEARLAYIDATKEKEKFLNDDFYNRNGEFDALFKSIDTSIIEKKNQYADVAELLSDIATPNESRSLLKQEENKNNLYKDNSKALRKYTDSEKKVRKEAERLYKLNPDRIDIEGTLLDNTYASGKYANALNNLQNALGWSTDDAQGLVDILIDAGIVQGSAADMADYSANSYNNFSSSVEEAINALSVLNTVMSESYSGQGITDQTLEQFKQTFGDGAYQALEKTANGYHINAQEAYSLRKQQEALVDTNYSSALSQQYNALNKLNEGYKKAIRDNEDTSAFAEQRKAIENNITKLQDRMMAFNNANSAYQTWLANQSNNGERQMYESIYGGFDAIKDEFEHGWAGIKTRSWMDLVLGDESEADFDVWDAQATELKERYDQLSKDIEGTGGYSIKDFFTADDNGKITSKGVMNFFKALENKQKEVLEEGEKGFIDLEEGWFDFTNGGDQRVADLFGIDIEAVDAILRAAAEAGAEVKLDQPIFSAERLEEEAIKAKTSLEKDLGGELNINLNPESIEEANLDMAKLTEYRDKLASDTSLEPTVKTKRLEELSDIMSYISTKEREIVENNIIDFEVKNTDLIKADKEINSIFSGLEHYSDRFGKRTDGIDKILSVDPSTLNDLNSLKYFYGTVKEAKLTPEVNDEQVAMLDALLKAIEDKINAINNKPVEGQSLSFSQYEQGLKTITQINDTIKKAKESGADFEFNWEGDEEFMSLVEFIDGLDTKQKMQLGLDPDINTQQILEIAKNGGTIELGVESNTTPAQLTAPQPQTKQELQQVITTELRAHDSASPTIEEASKSAWFFGKTYTAELEAKDNASKEIEKSQKAADKFGKTESRAKLGVDGTDSSNAAINAVRSSLLNIPNKISSSIHIDVSGAGKISNALDDLSKLRNAARNNIHLNITKANGTAHAQGTAFSKGSIVSGNAFAGGKWGISKNQTALTGELGTEIVVRDGNWFTVGEDGAEFVNLQKGDIVFNHKQAQELLENGYVTSNKGRGHLVGFANGSAFASGSAYGGGSKGSTTGMLNSTADKKTTSKTTSSNKDTSKGKTTPKTTDKEANKTKNTLDEVEILIARIERQIANLDKTISSTYKTWTTRNNAIKSDLAKVAQEIKDQNKAYTTYIKKANSVGLNATWKKKIQSGKFKIEDVTDDKLWQKIQDYKTYYEKALAAKDAVIDLKEKEGELYKQRFDNEQTYYEELIGDLEHTKNLLESYNDTLSESGKLGSQLLIRNQIAKENENIRLLNKEYDALITQRNEAVNSGKIKKYSEAWYEMTAAIQEVSESIAEAQNNVITLGNNIRQLDWDRWDKVHDAIGGVNNELEFLYDLFNSDDFFDEQGNLTDQGVTAFALLAQQYDTYFREAQEYQKEIEATEELLKANKGKNKYDQNLVDKLKELKESQQDAISSAKKMKESMVDLTEDGIKKQIDYIKDLIEDYEELLEAQKDQTDYAKKVADQQKEINKLEKQYRAIQNDTSEEGATKRQKLRDQINEKRQDLKDTQEDRRISETKDMLSDFEESFEQFLEDKLKDVEGIVRQVIDRTNANGTIINDTIAALANSYGYTPSDTLKNALTDLSNNLVSYFNGAFDNENVRTIVSGVDEIVRYYKEAQNKSEEKAGTLLQEQMRQKVKETGTHMQTYTDINGNTRTGFFNDNGTQDTKRSGWVEKDGKYYLFSNGTIEKKSQWYTDSKGNKYYLNSSGARVTGVQSVNGKTYFFGSNGINVGDKKGWVTSGTTKYYFNNGHAVTGWQTINKKKYYFDSNGKMYKGLKTIGNKKYYFDSNGVLLKGTWRKISNKQYYLDKKDGHVLTGKQTIDGKKYTFNADGTLKKEGWKKGTASVPKTGMAWTNEGYKAEAIIRKSDGAILTPLNKGDSVIPSNAMKNMYQALTDPEKYLKQYTTPDVRIIQGNGSTNNQSPTINMQFIANGVQDPNKFVNELMNNKKLEKWIQEVTLGQANGHNSFRKYSYAIR